ncbi:hypothetical protein F441_15007 [Phytophthora nicotianae CJ01A1]|uniref:Uncharacterized protein n=6 Tax=Phytophthora nicotianae TaxID=4792 RepID=W2PST2_PHYN3|nr:hypothetical protein PPTG_23735 [Phytophthora nicotianae INRA-310]ETI39183.1 hypothetical protein F443_15197 [Phytophthora nicotianae P1569]ETK79398.1 hypothetical protein L915_14735 [Phytophthora nicotianae]ETO67940.1 hypothetical protein F444_15175 [Phytophthora nicotianae P1976]ETP09095.1 hypothetical protein F441_15007 [Phytophthora nicotianae CJ01A1]ETP37133.1 hypothetical protein F442_15030 [Phytophthora nicotianae P10297]
MAAILCRAVENNTAVQDAVQQVTTDSLKCLARNTRRSYEPEQRGFKLPTLRTRGHATGEDYDANETKRCYSDLLSGSPMTKKSLKSGGPYW